MDRMRTVQHQKHSNGEKKMRSVQHTLNLVQNLLVKKQKSSLLPKDKEITIKNRLFFSGLGEVFAILSPPSCCLTAFP